MNPRNSLCVLILAPLKDRHDNQLSTDVGTVSILLSSFGGNALLCEYNVNTATLGSNFTFLCAVLLLVLPIVTRKLYLQL